VLLTITGRICDRTGSVLACSGYGLGDTIQLFIIRLGTVIPELAKFVVYLPASAPACLFRLVFPAFGAERIIVAFHLLIQ